jgi:hypothetical protein
MARLFARGLTAHERGNEMDIHPDSQHLAEFGYKQELHRTLGSFSSFAAGYSYISVLVGMFQTSVLGFLFAGSAFGASDLPAGD